MTFFCRDRHSDNICRCPDRSRTSTDICTHCQCPCKNREIHTCRCCQSLDNRDHGCGKWNIIYKCTCDRGYPDNNGYHYLGISMAYLPDKSGCQFQNTGLLQTTDYNKQTNKKKDRLIIYIFKICPIFFPDVRRTSIAINRPINATVSPVCACVISKATAHKKITQLMANARLSVIADTGDG